MMSCDPSYKNLENQTASEGITKFKDFLTQTIAEYVFFNASEEHSKRKVSYYGYILELKLSWSLGSNINMQKYEFDQIR